MSMSASGKIGERLVFSKRASGQQARFQKAQKDKITLPRCTNRFLYSLASITWKYLSQVQKDVYNVQAVSMKITGYNYFMSLALADPKTYLGLVGYWPFDEVTGAVAYDKSKQGNNGAFKTTYPTNCPVRIPAFNQKLGNAVYSSSSDKYILCTGGYNFKDFGNHNFTLSCFVTPKQLNVLSLFISNYYSRGVGIELYNNYFYVAIGYSIDGTWGDYIKSSKPYIVDRTYHVAFVRSGNNLSFYVDSVYQGAVTGFTSDVTASVSQISLCSRSGSWGGFVDLSHPMCFNRALSVNEIKEIHRRAFDK